MWDGGVGERRGEGSRNTQETNIGLRYKLEYKQNLRKSQANTQTPCHACPVPPCGFAEAPPS